MKLILISPFEYLNESTRISNHHMVLGHLLSNQKYKNFYKNIKKEQPDSFVICDNSANEGYMLKGQELISLAAEINADEIIAPDKYHDAETTYKETMSFLDDYYDDYLKNNYKVMAVPQGDTLEDYYDCYCAFVDDERIDTIGIGYRNLIPAVMDNIADMNKYDFNISDEMWSALNNHLEDNCFNYTMSRLWFLRMLVKFKKLAIRNKQIHLLGLYNPYEIKILNTALKKAEKKRIRSCDSAAPWQAAQASVVFNKNYGVVTKPKEYVDFEQLLTDDQMVIFNQNINLIKEWNSI